ncbi:MAG: histidine kinase, partial [Nanoarchaeota archaeon]|nr:histidine kinase [Nanoarchaeota archaeon]
HKIKYIILHHQDPDLCASVPLFEKELKKEFKIFIPARSSVFCRFYGIKSETVSVNKDYVRLRMSSGRELQFFMTPYVHAPGAMITYDAKNKLVFTSDIFGAFEPDWNLYVKEKDKHLKLVKAFMEPYMGCKPALMNVAKKLQQLDIELICPQHGSIIDSDIKWWIKQLTKMRTGLALREEVKWW